jgi:hypothetical protein
MYQHVFSSERWRRWHGSIRYPFYVDDFLTNTLLPEHIVSNHELKLDFYSSCEFWFDCCLTGDVFEMQKDLPSSGGGLGLVCLQDILFQDLADEMFGLLEFVNLKLFNFLKQNNYPSLYQTREGDFCVMFGPLSLCNNGRGIEQNYYPEFKDRHMITDEELMFCSSRKEYGSNQVSFPPVQFVYILFNHFSLRLHVVNNMLLFAGEQIFVDYGHVTVTK